MEKFIKPNWPVKGEEIPFTEENDQGIRVWWFDCGCVATSGAGAYGSTGDAWAIDHCPKHYRGGNISVKKEKTMKKLLLEILIIVLFVSGFGFWATNEWRKRYPEPVKVEKQVKVYQGQWRKTYLEVMK